MNLKEHRRSIYDSLVEMGLELKPHHLEVLSDGIKDYAKQKHSLLVKEKQALKDALERRNKIRKSKVVEKEETSMFTIPKNIRR
tara:strand:- start:4437 stop:4688 length:252 start_codon:yes stop_codon:yes gene_type:complete